MVHEKSELTINSLQSELASIRRGLGQDQLLDVRTFVYPKHSSPLRPISPKAQYVPEDDFYANLNLPEWRHGVMDGEAFGRAAFGNSAIDASSPAFQKILRASQFHVWSPNAGPTSVTVKDVDGSTFFRAGPFITVQKSSIRDTLGIVGKYLPEIRQPETGQKISPEKIEEIKGGMAELDDLFRGDAAGLFLGDLARQHFSQLTSTTNVRSQLAEVQKVGNVLYVQFLTTLTDAEVDGKHFPRFFIREEIILVTDQVNLTTIEVIVPSPDPTARGPVYAQVQEWFSELAIPVN